MGYNWRVLVSTSPARPPKLIRDEIAELTAYLDGVPKALLDSGALGAYERRLAELQQELTLITRPQQPSLNNSRPKAWGGVVGALSLIPTYLYTIWLGLSLPLRETLVNSAALALSLSTSLFVWDAVAILTRGA